MQSSYLPRFEQAVVGTATSFAFLHAFVILLIRSRWRRSCLYLPKKKFPVVHKAPSTLSNRTRQALIAKSVATCSQTLSAPRARKDVFGLMPVTGLGPGPIVYQDMRSVAKMVHQQLAVACRHYSIVDGDVRPHLIPFRECVQYVQALLGIGSEGLALTDYTQLVAVYEVIIFGDAAGVSSGEYAAFNATHRAIMEALGQTKSLKDSVRVSELPFDVDLEYAHGDPSSPKAAVS
mmetsp:Transcript_108414/g.187273  ORF Transcript_108414/g.187273 Transcript_108414/m.187273 type:complete len:234 (-) Transcript_108414:762-1463(-)